MDYSTMEAGREMDKLVAERVMGWELHPNHTHWGGPSKAWKNTTSWRPCWDFQPSTEISAAWEVVEKLEQSMGWAFNRLTPHEYLFEFFNDSMGRAMAISDSAPLAICRAALMAVNT